MPTVRLLSLALTALILLPSCGSVPRSLEGSLDPFLAEAALSLGKLENEERFPNIVVTLEGTVVVTWGSSGVYARRSEDGGETWGPEIVVARPGFHGGGLTVDEVTGDLLAFAEARHPPAPRSVYRSQDDGRTWVLLEAEFRPDGNGNELSLHMNEHGITLRHGAHRGRLIRAARYYGKTNHRDHWPEHYTSAIYSDDRGLTWEASAPFPENGTGEACIVELSDGRLYYNSRVHWEERPQNLRRREAWSDDGGETWKDWKIVEILPDGPQDTNYGCMGGLVRLPVAGRDILVYTNTKSDSGRKNGAAWLSLDGGRTWPVHRVITPDRFAYSSLAAGRPGTVTEGWIYCHYEGGGSRVARFNLSWLLEGEPTGDGEVPASP